jgi:hypothetical protein
MLPKNQKNQESKTAEIKQSMQHRQAREKAHVLCRSEIQNKGIGLPL